MVAPRITQCGHIFCWPCALQYLAYQREEEIGAVCPLCEAPMSASELRSVKV